MSKFTAPLAVIQTENGDWQTASEVVYFSACEELDLALEVRCREKYIVPAGFITDFASIPRLFWTVVGHPAGKYAQAAVLHDYLYRTNSVSRAKADSLFREAMIVLGVPFYQRWVLWAGVRVGGFIAYNRTDTGARDEFGP